MRKKINDILFKIFWKTEDSVIKNDNNTGSFQVCITPRFGRLGIFTWYILTEYCRLKADE